jgi:hypothetical protein
MPHVEEPERFLAVVGAFLDEADSLLEAGP